MQLQLHKKGHPHTQTHTLFLMSFLEAITLAPPDAVFGVADAFNKDTHPDKINLGVGAYRDDAGKPWVLPVVREAERRILEKGFNKEYLPMAGHAEFRRLAAELLYGEDQALLSRVACVQTLSGTGALRVCGEFLKQFHPSPAVYVTEPTYVLVFSFSSCFLPLTFKTQDGATISPYLSNADCA